VKQALVEIYSGSANVDQAAALHWIEDMGTQNRYVLDVWAGS
jgi:cytochrome P450 / NADPH-cytochrome P450 reductase